MMKTVTMSKTRRAITLQDASEWQRILSKKGCVFRVNGKTDDGQFRHVNFQCQLIVPTGIVSYSTNRIICRSNIHTTGTLLRDHQHHRHHRDFRTSVSSRATRD